MGKKRQNGALPAGCVATKGTVPKDGSIPPPSKQPLSAAAIFKQNPKSAKETPPLSSQSPAVHPVAAAFNESTQAYRNTLYKSTAKKLDETLSHLLTRMHDFNATTTSTPSRTSDLTGSPEESALFRRVGSYNVSMEQGEERDEKTLEEILSTFAAEHKTRFEEINDLERQWEKLVGEIWEVGVNCLGADMMLPLLSQSSSPSSLPAHKKGGNSALGDSTKSGPVRKKVKFQEPEPELPRFLSVNMNHTKVSHPKPISDEEVKNLEGKIDALGVHQVEEFVRIEKESKQSWAKKLREVLDLLKDE